MFKKFGGRWYLAINGDDLMADAMKEHAKRLLDGTINDQIARLLYDNDKLHRIIKYGMDGPGYYVLEKDFNCEFKFYTDICVYVDKEEYKIRIWDHLPNKFDFRVEGDLAYISYRNGDYEETYIMNYKNGTYVHDSKKVEPLYTAMNMDATITYVNGAMDAWQENKESEEKNDV